MKLVPFSTNSHTSDTGFWVSDDRHEEFMSYSWFLVNWGNKKYYVCRSASKKERELGSPTQISAHRQVLNIHLRFAKKYEVVDHINGNTLDNTIENLVLTSNHKNSRNAKNNTGLGKGLWGASYDDNGTRIKKWKSVVWYKGKSFNLGRFQTELEAHKIAIEKFKELTGKDPEIEGHFNE